MSLVSNGAKVQNVFLQKSENPETAVLKVLADILLALDYGDLAALTLLDLSAAFDSVDHETLLRRLQASYGRSETLVHVLSE